MEFNRKYDFYVDEFNWVKIEDGDFDDFVKLAGVITSAGRR